MKEFDIPRSEIEKLINEWILNQKYRQVLKRRLLDGVMDELMTTLQAVNPRLYAGVMRRIKKSG